MTSPPIPAREQMARLRHIDSLGRTDADLLRLVAKDHERLAPNAHHSAETLRQIADRLMPLYVTDEGDKIARDPLAFASQPRPASEPFEAVEVGEGGKLLSPPPVEPMSEEERQAEIAKCVEALKREHAKAQPRPASEQGAILRIVNEWLIELENTGCVTLRDNDHGDLSDIAALLAQREPEGWRDIASAPKDGTPLLLFARCKTATAPIRLVGWYVEPEGWVESCFMPNRPTGVVPTHWQPLPTPPSEAGE